MTHVNHWRKPSLHSRAAVMINAATGRWQLAKREKKRSLMAVLERAELSKS